MGKNKWLRLFSAVVASSVPRSGVDEEESDVQTGLVLSFIYSVEGGNLSKWGGVPRQARGTSMGENLICV